MDTLGHALNDFAPQLFALLVRGTLLLVIALAVVRLLAGASASVRHLVWASALSGLLILPVVSVLVPAIEVRVLPAETGLKEVPATRTTTCPGPATGRSACS